MFREVVFLRVLHVSKSSNKVFSKSSDHFFNIDFVPIEEFSKMLGFAIKEMRSEQFRFLSKRLPSTMESVEFTKQGRMLSPFLQGLGMVDLFLKGLLLTKIGTKTLSNAFNDG